MLKLGLTGNICAGKSEVEKILTELGFFVVDLDKIVHSFFENNEKVKSQIIKHFKTLDRKSIASIVFQNSDKKRILENIIHPELKKYVLDLFKEKNEAIVVSGALLYEAGFDSFFDKIIYIDAQYNLRLKRLMKRNNLDEKEAKLRLDNQKNNKNRADFVIENNDSIEELRKKVETITTLL